MTGMFGIISLALQQVMQDILSFRTSFHQFLHYTVDLVENISLSQATDST